MNDEEKKSITTIHLPEGTERVITMGMRQMAEGATVGIAVQVFHDNTHCAAVEVVPGTTCASCGLPVPEPEPEPEDYTASLRRALVQLEAKVEDRRAKVLQSIELAFERASENKLEEADKWLSDARSAIVDLQTLVQSVKEQAKRLENPQ